jgi:glutamate formiminotransferase/formiminotetrahydrofolate cyclodeaminase
MVSNLTVGKKGAEEDWEELKAVAVSAQALKDELIRDVDRDTRAFNAVMDAIRMPKGTPEQAEEKARAVEAALKGAAIVPLEVLEKAVALADLAKTAARKGNRNSLSDAGVAALAAGTAGEGAFYNVLINLPDIGDAKFKDTTRLKAEKHRKRLRRIVSEVGRIMDGALDRPASPNGK